MQTLEPRLYYVKIPYQNQNTLPVYDSSLAPLSFAQLFTENRFYGNDRIGDADMATLGLTSRLIDSEGGIERLRLGVAERFSFTTPQVTQAIAPTIPATITPPYPDANSDILFSAGGKISRTITMDSLFDYNPYGNYTASGNISISFRPETGKLLNLGYHFTQDPATPANDVRQDDFSAQWPLFWHWYAVTRLSYSVQDHILSERLIGLEYNQSCWMLRFVAQRFQTSLLQASTGIFIQLELNDLVALGSDPLSALRSSIPGYTKLNLTPATKPVQSSP